MLHRLAALVLLSLGWLLTIAASASPVELHDPNQTYDLFRAGSLLAVRPGQVSIQDLLPTPGRYAFVPTRNARLNAQGRQRAYWFRVDLTRRSADDFSLRIDHGSMERVTVYLVADGRVVASRQLGTLVPASTDYAPDSDWLWPLALPVGQPHTVYVYMEGLHATVPYIRAQTTATLLGTIRSEGLFTGLYYGLILLIVLYSLLRYIRRGERDTLFFAIWVSFTGLQLASYPGVATGFPGAADPLLSRYGSVIGGITGLVHLLFTVEFLRLRQLSPRFYRVGLFIAGVCLASIGLLTAVAAINERLNNPTDAIPPFALVAVLFSGGAGLTGIRRGFRPARLYVIGNLVALLSMLPALACSFSDLPRTFWTRNSLQIGSGTEIILFTLALTYKADLLKEGQDDTIREQLRLTDKDRRLAQEQNAGLKQQIQVHTTDLDAQKKDLQVALASLRQTREQLMRLEKLASLGELTAGIAHEIQNPLNFVNNYAEVSVELVDELTDGLRTGDSDTVRALSDDIRANLQYIVQNGQRASGIVRNMLYQAHASSEQRELTDLNTLADEYLRLAYQGLRAKDPSFTAQLQTDYDPALPLTAVVPQAIGRVLLNLLNNAFYAVQQKGQSAKGGFVPVVQVCTRHTSTHVLVTVRDNGPGIDPAVLDKLFQPFFTTKPTGQGTGLGLSISYDIITNGHGGQLCVDSQPNAYTEFSLRLPLAAS